MSLATKFLLTAALMFFVAAFFGYSESQQTEEDSRLFAAVVAGFFSLLSILSLIAAPLVWIWIQR